MFKRLDDQMLVAAQIEPGDVAAAAGEGVTMIINNRPDDEAPDQPEGAAIAAAAAAAGLAYRAIPVTHAGLSMNQVAAMQEALSEAQGPVLAFCRSGTRSTLVWALARNRMGDSPEDLAHKAANAGYDLTPVMPFMTR